MYGGLASGAGTYQHTKDGKTIVWNDNPKPGDLAAWSGDRDRDGYATGFGTLTWYRPQPETGKPTIYDRLFGNMIRGKFDGPVNLHSKGKTDYAIFVDGRRTSRWMAGTAPSRIQLAKQPPAPGPEAPAEGPRTKRAVAKAENEQAPTLESENARERTAQPIVVESETASVEPSHSPSERTDEAGSESAANKKPKIEVNDSLRSLAGPPSSLRTNPVADESSLRAKLGPMPSASVSPHLSREEVIDLADAEARRHGYDLAEYERPDPKYNAADNTWSVFYSQPALDPIIDIGKGFSLTVDDKTKKTSIVSPQ